jgi:hypothetical protein
VFQLTLELLRTDVEVLGLFLQQVLEVVGEELHTRRVDRRSNGECLGRSCLALDQELDAKLPILFAASNLAA